MIVWFLGDAVRSCCCANERRLDCMECRRFDCEEAVNSFDRQPTASNALNLSAFVKIAVKREEEVLETFVMCLGFLYNASLLSVSLRNQ